MYQSSVLPEEIERLDLAAFRGKITVIDKIGAEFDRAIKYLKRQSVIGFDTESRPTFSPSQPHYGVSLLQLSGPREAFLFRVKLMGMDPKLCSILSDPKIIKVGAAVNDDIRGLQRRHEFTPSAFVDLQKIVWEYGIKDKSVKKMAAIILGVKISKTQQLSNWEAEELSDSQQLYAATDAWVCREMYNKLLKSEKNTLSYEEMHPQQAQKQNTESLGAESKQETKKPSNQERKRKKHHKKRRNKNVAGLGNKSDSENANNYKAKNKRTRNYFKRKKKKLNGKGDIKEG